MIVLHLIGWPLVITVVTACAYGIPEQLGAAAGDHLTRKGAR